MFLLLSDLKKFTVFRLFWHHCASTFSSSVWACCLFRPNRLLPAAAAAATAAAAHDADNDNNSNNNNDKAGQTKALAITTQYKAVARQDVRDWDRCQTQASPTQR